MKRDPLSEQFLLSRRRLMQQGLGALFAAAMPLPVKLASAATLASKLLGFEAVPVAHLLDEVVVPKGYRTEVFYRWGDPVSSGPEFKIDASNTAAEQALQAGMHHDAMQFMPLSASQTHGLLVMNHEYIDAQLLHCDGGIFDAPDNYTAEKTAKEQQAHGVSIIEVKQQQGRWQIQRPSAYARRITATTPMRLSGPAAGSKWLKTEADPEGRYVLGTFNNCSNGLTPWGTYLTCEENFNDYFKLTQPETASAEQQQRWQRYDIKSSYYGWHVNDARFDVDQHPNEANRFGWIVEIDPLNPASTPIKRTAMGRFCHENVAHKVAASGKVAFYSGDDSRFEYVYKFVTDKAWDGTAGAHHGELLDSGTLFVARFNEDGSGDWLPLEFGNGPLTQDSGFSSQADVLVHARLAADAVGATPMDRPEWITAHPETGDLYVSMTNNSQRATAGKAGIDAANPRAENLFGHIMRMQETDADAEQFSWELFALAGSGDQQGNINGDIFANPDGLMIDPRGVLWIQTDVSDKQLNTGEFAEYGNNQMLAADPATGEVRRFLTGPVGCEITGMTLSPDMRTLWVNIQHPGQVPDVLAQRGVKKSPQQPNAASNWPDHQPNGRPRSATIMITREDGGVIGA
jgi:secreted PhoX family phosphatase